MFSHILLIINPMKVAVTRLDEKSEGTPELFHRYGHRAVLVPIIKSAPVKDTASLEALCTKTRKGEVGFLIFSSTLGVKYFFEHCTSIPDSTILICVGPKTAQALTQRGMVCETIASYSSDHFASHLGQRVKGKLVGVVRPDVPNPDLVGSLENLGAQVMEAVAYTLVPTGIDLKQTLLDVDAVIFTSGKSFTLARVSASDLVGKTVIAIGPKTARVMEQRRVTPDIVANGTLEGCLERLNAHSR